MKCPFCSADNRYILTKRNGYAVLERYHCQRYFSNKLEAWRWLENNGVSAEMVVDNFEAGSNTCQITRGDNARGSIKHTTLAGS